MTQADRAVRGSWLEAGFSPSSLKGAEKEQCGLVLRKTRSSFVSHLEDILCINAYRDSQNSFVTASLVPGQGEFSQAQPTQICLRRDSQIIPIFGLVLRKRGQIACFKKLSGTLNNSVFFFFLRGGDLVGCPISLLG